MNFDDPFLPDDGPELTEITYSNPPSNTDAERTILGAILLDSNAILEAGETLVADDFSLDSHRRIFLRMSELNDAGTTIDIVTLAEQLSRFKEIEHVGGVSYLASLTEGLPRRPVIEDYIRIVKDKSIVRRLMAVANDLLTKTSDQSEDALGIASWAQVEIGSLIEKAGSIGGDSIDLGQATVQALDEFESRRTMAGASWLSYGMLRGLDELTGGMFDGEVTVVGGESGVGKSSAMVQGIVRTAQEGHPVVCYSLEMTKSQLLGKIWSILSGVPYKFIRWPHSATEEQAHQIRVAARKVAQWPLSIYDRGGMTLAEILGTARLHIKRHNARLMCVDYLQRITVNGFKDERLKIAEASRKLADLVKSTKCHLMLLSQLRRREDNSFPNMRDLRESGQIENDAHCIVLLWREFDKDRGCFGTNGMVIIPKQRFGFTGNVKTIFNKDLVVFE
jgi:replicative DNA helicase